MVRCWRAPNAKDAYWLSWVSLLLALAAFIAGVLMYLSTGSSLALLFGMENLVDSFSSLVVLWRFFAPGSKLTKEVEDKLDRREQRASMAISFLMIVLGIVIIVTAALDFARGQESPDHLDEIIAVSFFSILIFGTLAGFKFHYSNALESAALYRDGLCSLIGTILAGTLFVNTLIIKGNETFWWVDPVVSMFCGVGALVLGLWQVYKASKEGLPLFSLKWWLLSQGDSKKEQPSADIELELKSADEDVENPEII